MRLCRGTDTGRWGYELLGVLKSLSQTSWSLYDPWVPHCSDTKLGENGGGPPLLGAASRGLPTPNYPLCAQGEPHGVGLLTIHVLHQDRGGMGGRDGGKLAWSTLGPNSPGLEHAQKAAAWESQSPLPPSGKSLLHLPSGQNGIQQWGPHTSLQPTPSPLHTAGLRAAASWRDS